jgi:hypothetical protein
MLMGVFLSVKRVAVLHSRICRLTNRDAFDCESVRVHAERNRPA